MNDILKKIEKIAYNKYTIIAFMVFLIIQPIMDLNVLFTDEIINIFKFSPATIIRMAYIIIMCCLLIFSHKNKKQIKYFVIAGICTVIYSVIHIYNCLKINEQINPNYRVSVVSEIFYIIRMILPLCIVYISYNYKMNFKNLSIIITSVVLIFSCTIIITHFTKLSLKSYGEDVKK